MERVKIIVVAWVTVLILGFFVAWWHSDEPQLFDVEQVTAKALATKGSDAQVVTGVTTTQTLIHVTETLMYKHGGFMSNDILPPFVMMDNIPAWETGALDMIRDMALAMRKDFSRSQSQSLENPFLVDAQPKLNIDHRRWAVPSPENEYLTAVKLLRHYRDALQNPANREHQFYARADNLRDWLKLVEKRLGGYSQRLSASIGQEVLKTDLSGVSAANQSTYSPEQMYLQTSWWLIDDEFYEARGAAWVLLHLLKAIEIDFADVLAKKNATVSLQQIIRELEATQKTVWSPMVLNGSGFGVMANHSLVMANYISRANAALIDLTDLLSQG